MEAGSNSTVTRAHLAQWGFLRLPDVWLCCPSEGRRKYFERWYHASWNYTAVIGLPGKDPLHLHPADFLAGIQARLGEDEEVSQAASWDDLYQNA